MSSIHEIARLEEQSRFVLKTDEDIDELPQDSIHEEFQRFEQSISNIDSRFHILNSNLVKYKLLTESARKALISRENTANRKQRSAMGIIESSSGFPTDRINEEVDSSMALNVEEYSNAEGGFLLNKTQDDPDHSHIGMILRDVDDEDESDYQSDFEVEENLSPKSTASPAMPQGRLNSRSNQRSSQLSNGAFSPTVYRSQAGTANGTRNKNGPPSSNL